MASSAEQSVVAFTVMVTSASESGVTVYLPLYVLARLQPPHVAHRAIGHREGVVPNPRVAEAVPAGASLNRSSKVNAALPSWDEGPSWIVAVKGGCVTAVVAALVTDSSFPASSVKDT